ncbi:NAD-dependent epimerase/dehydratase family protein [Candidatus Micrarchaeota archaeon]|nr:NAD-dependent epimerase/dehydratase family protein [Candidatus Micrarchaeota archaeon]
MRIYLTGANGRLGREVLKRIPEAAPLVRKASGLKSEIITDFSIDSLRPILADADILIHLAGSLDMENKEALREGNVELTRRLEKAAPKRCRIVYASSIAVYGKTLAQIPAREETAIKPDSEYSRTKLEAENIVRSRPNHIILRIGTIYGPGFEDYFRILERIEKGKMQMIGSGNNRIPFVHVEDVADAITRTGGKVNGTFVLAGEAKTQKEIFEIAARELKVHPPKKKMPKIVAMAAVHLQKLMGKREAARKFTIEHVLVLSSDRAFDCTKAKKELGFSPRSIEQGIVEMVQRYRNRAQASI